VSPAIAIERDLRFACFGGTVGVRASHSDSDSAQDALQAVRTLLLEVHDRLTRFEPDSELSRLNRDPRERVPASPLLCRFADAVRWAGAMSGGLVDPTVLPAVEAAGYVDHLDPDGADVLDRVRPPARPTAPPTPAPGGWVHVGTDGDHVVRPLGVRIDSGGIGKGLAADLAAERLLALAAWAVDCGGDLRIGGGAGVPRSVEITDPFTPGLVVHRFRVTRGAVATSGTTRRRWRTDEADGMAHHLIDPRTGAPADTGIVQATALAPSGLEAEVRAKTALLAGPRRARRALPHGGAYVTADRRLHIVPAPQRIGLPASRLAA